MTAANTNKVAKQVQELIDLIDSQPLSDNNQKVQNIQYCLYYSYSNNTQVIYFVTCAQDREVLPCNVRPRHYFISYTSIDLGKDFKFEARVEIDLEVNEDTQKIVLNSADIEFLSIKVTQNENTQQIKVSSIQYEKKVE